MKAIVSEIARATSPLTAAIAEQGFATWLKTSPTADRESLIRGHYVNRMSKALVKQRLEDAVLYHHAAALEVDAPIEFTGIIPWLKEIDPVVEQYHFMQGAVIRSLGWKINTEFDYINLPVYPEGVIGGEPTWKGFDGPEEVVAFIRENPDYLKGLVARGWLRNKQLFNFLKVSIPARALLLETMEAKDKFRDRSKDGVNDKGERYSRTFIRKSLAPERFKLLSGGQRVTLATSIYTAAIKLASRAQRQRIGLQAREDRRAEREIRLNDSQKLDARYNSDKGMYAEEKFDHLDSGYHGEDIPTLLGIPWMESQPMEALEEVREWIETHIAPPMLCKILDQYPVYAFIQPFIQKVVGTTGMDEFIRVQDFDQAVQIVSALDTRGYSQWRGAQERNNATEAAVLASSVTIL